MKLVSMIFFLLRIDTIILSLYEIINYLWLWNHRKSSKIICKYHKVIFIHLIKKIATTTSYDYFIWFFSCGGGWASRVNQIWGLGLKSLGTPVYKIKWSLVSTYFYEIFWQIFPLKKILISRRRIKCRNEGYIFTV